MCLDNGAMKRVKIKPSVSVILGILMANNYRKKDFVDMERMKSKILELTV
jgi:hypothetical protein